MKHLYTGDRIVMCLFYNACGKKSVRCTLFGTMERYTIKSKKKKNNPKRGLHVTGSALDRSAQP